MISIKNRSKNYLNFYNLILLLIIITGISFRLICYFYERTLWLDEAMLAKSVLTRDYYGLSKGFLDYGQSAPLGFLFVCKLFNSILPSPELGLRAFPMICGIISIFMTYKVSKDVFKSKLPLYSTAMVSAIGILISQSNMFKAYSSDVLFSLLSIWTYNNFKENRIKFNVLSVLYSIFVWFSFGNLFIMGSICIYHFFNEVIINKTKTYSKKIFDDILPLLLVGLSVLVYYLFWIKPSTSNIDSESNEYWKWLSFPIIPTSFSDIKLIFQMLINFISPVNKYLSIPLLIVTLISVFYNIRRWFTQILIVSTIIVMIVSSVGLFPITIRLQLFLYVLYLIFGCYFIELIIANCAKNKITNILLIMIIGFPTLLISLVIHNNQRFLYMYGEEFKQCYNYIEKNINNKDMIYFPWITRPMAELYSGYKIPMNFNMGTIYDGNKIWGSKYRIMSNHEPYKYDYLINDSILHDNVNSITQHESVYIIESHKESDLCMNVLYENLKKYGTLKEVYNFHGSKVYHYESIIHKNE